MLGPRVEFANKKVPNMLGSKLNSFYLNSLGMFLPDFPRRKVKRTLYRLVTSARELDVKGENSNRETPSKRYGLRTNNTTINHKTLRILLSKI